MLHARIGVLFGVFCTGLLVWHLFTPWNPDHYVNLVMHSSMATLFLVSARLSIKTCRIIHPVVLFIGATLTVWYGNFPVGATIFGLATLLYYSYGGFRSFSLAQASGSFAIVFTAFFAAILASGYGFGPSYGTAFIWTTVTAICFYIIWLVLQYFASDIIIQNRDLLELTKKIKKGECADVTTKRG